MKKNNGITLIALVITIIVLLILAGVAIAMLSGENGILRKAADAKTQTEQAQKEEETTLKDMELATYFSTKNMRYKCRNGYMTGFNWWEDEKVEKLETALKPLEYKINMKYDVNEKKDVPIENKSDTPVATGMLVEDKNGEPVARIVVFGDINCDGDLTGDDYFKFLRYVYNTEKLEEDFIKAAMDLNFDSKINAKDLKLSKDYYLEFVDIPQSQYVSDPNKIIVDMESCLRYEYVRKRSTNDIYIVEYDEATDRYNFNVKTSETKVEDFLSTLIEGGKIKRNGQEVAATENVQNGDEVVYVSNEKEIDVGKIIIE